MSSAVLSICNCARCQLQDGDKEPQVILTIRGPVLVGVVSGATKTGKGTPGSTRPRPTGLLRSLLVMVYRPEGRDIVVRDRGYVRGAGSFYTQAVGGRGEGRDGIVIRDARYNSRTRLFAPRAGSTPLRTCIICSRYSLLVPALWIVWIEVSFVETVASLKRDTQ